MADSYLSSVKEVDENTSKDSLVPLNVNRNYPSRPRSRSVCADVDSTSNSNSGGDVLLQSGTKDWGRRGSNVPAHSRANSKLKYEISASTDDASRLQPPHLIGVTASDGGSTSSSVGVDRSGRSLNSVDPSDEGTRDGRAAPLVTSAAQPIGIQQDSFSVRAPPILSNPLSPTSPTTLPPYSSPISKLPLAINASNEADTNASNADTTITDKAQEVSKNPSRSNTKSSPSPNTEQTKKTVLELLFIPLDETSASFITWNFLINVLHAVEIILIPLQLAWTEYFIHFGVVVSQLMVDFLFLADCFFLSRVIYRDEYGILCTDRKRLRQKYLWKEFGIVKVLASLPVELLVFLPGFPAAVYISTGVPFGYSLALYSQYKNWAVVCFLKMLIKIPYKRIYAIAIPGVAMPISRLIKTMLILMLMGHYDACLFWFIDQILPPPYRWVDHFKLVPFDIYTKMFTTQYLVSYLSALRSLVLHLREVQMDAENIYVVFEFVFGILAYGTVFGNIQSIVEMLDNTAASNHAEEQHKFQMEWLKNYMREKRLLPEIQKMVTAHKELQWQKSKGMDESKMFEDLPRSVQQEIKNFLYLDLVKKVPVFQGTDTNFQNLLCFKIRVGLGQFLKAKVSVHVLDGWFIFRKGDEGDEMYFIKTGEVQICSEEGIVFVTLSTGSFFGEIALFEACKRTAAAKAKGNVELCMLKKDDFAQIMGSYPHVAELIRETIRSRKEQEEKIKADKLREDARKEEESKKRQDRWTRRKSRTSNTSGSRRSLENSMSVFNMISRNLSVRSKVNSATSQSVFGSATSVGGHPGHSGQVIALSASENAGIIGMMKSKSFARNKIETLEVDKGLVGGS
ncbi:hypothetical protein HDU67_006021 [Dinochytrium kinnereticum]|nr:hypothetical protein HDU67_006021 [Dinochytrium kinnereticum]